jgi:signal peptidase II
VNNPRSKYLLLLMAIVLSLVVLDQASKLAVQSALSQAESVRVIGNFLRVTLVHNEGGAFSTRLGSSLFYMVGSIVVSIFVFYYLIRHHGHDRCLDLALAVIAGGAIGNLIDRFRLGYVIDWVDVEFFDIVIQPGRFLFWEHSGYQLLRWPVFNVADAAVTVGIILLIVRLLIPQRRPSHADPEPAS